MIFFGILQVYKHLLYLMWHQASFAYTHRSNSHIHAIHHLWIQLQFQFAIFVRTRLLIAKVLFLRNTGSISRES